MVTALRTALGKIPDAKLIALGTRPARRRSLVRKGTCRGADYSQTHAAAPADPPFRRRTWKKANPSLDFMPDLESTIRQEAHHARTDPALFPGFRALRLNGGTSDTEESMLIDAGTWETIEGERDRAGPSIWGADLGTSAAMSAVAAFWPETGRLESVAAFPHEPTLAERGLRDGAGGLYQQCSERGELIQTGQRAVALPGLLREALDRFGRPARIAGGKPNCAMRLTPPGYRPPRSKSGAKASKTAPKTFEGSGAPCSKGKSPRPGHFYSDTQWARRES